MHVWFFVCVSWLKPCFFGGKFGLGLSFVHVWYSPLCGAFDLVISSLMKISICNANNSGPEAGDDCNLLTWRACQSAGPLIQEN